MTKDILKYALLFIGLVFFQVLLFNHITIFNVAFPIIFIYFIIRLPISLNKSYLFTFSFLLGLIIDIFSDTLGVNALACTLLSGIKRPAFYAYVAKDDKTKNITPSIRSIGFMDYSKFLLTMVGIYCLLAFTIEYFNFADVKELMVLTVSSCLLTFLTLLALDCLIIPKS